MVGNDADHAFLHLFHLPLSEADELYVVVLQPLGVSLAQRFDRPPVLYVSIKPGDPGAGVLGMAGVGRITRNHQDGLMSLTAWAASFTSCDSSGTRKFSLRFYGFQGVGQVDVQPLAGLHRVALVSQELRQLQMRDRVRGNQIFESRTGFLRTCSFTI